MTAQCRSLVFGSMFLRFLRVYHHCLKAATCLSCSWVPAPFCQTSFFRSGPDQGHDGWPTILLWTGFRIDVPHRHLEMWLRRKRPPRSLYESRGAFCAFVIYWQRRYAEHSPTVPRRGVHRATGAAASAQRRSFWWPSTKMRRRSCSTCRPPFPQIVRDRAGGCLTISGAAFPAFSWRLFAQPAPKRDCTRVGMCICKEPLKTTDQQWRAQCSRLPKEAFPTKEDHHLLKEGQPPAWR